MTASARQLSLFLQQNLVSEMLAGAYLKAEGSEKTQASYLSTLCNNRPPFHRTRRSPMSFQGTISIST